MASEASAAMKMHDDEADIDAEIVRRLVAAQAVLLIPYYRETNPAMAALARRTVAQVVGDVTSARHEPPPGPCTADGNPHPGAFQA